MRFKLLFLEVQPNLYPRLNTNVNSWYTGTINAYLFDLEFVHRDYIDEYFLRCSYCKVFDMYYTDKNYTNKYELNVAETSAIFNFDVFEGPLTKVSLARKNRSRVQRI